MLNALVLSHLHYSSVSINGISQTLRITSEKQLSSAVKACFRKMNYESSRDLKLQYQTLPVMFYLDLKAVLYLWNYKNDLSLVFQHQIITTVKPKVLKRSNRFVYDSMANSSYLSNSFFKQAGNGPSQRHI